MSAGTSRPITRTNNDSNLGKQKHFFETGAINEFLEYVHIVRQTPFDLPKTVSLIECSNGTKVYLVGTAHFSKESISDVHLVCHLYVRC